jgi:hypothetical protein
MYRRLCGQTLTSYFSSSDIRATEEYSCILVADKLDKEKQKETKNTAHLFYTDSIAVRTLLPRSCMHRSFFFFFFFFFAPSTQDYLVYTIIIISMKIIKNYSPNAICPTLRNGKYIQVCTLKHALYKVLYKYTAKFFKTFFYISRFFQSCKYLG